MKIIRSALAWVSARVELKREAGSDLYGWYNAVLLRVGRWTIHVGIDSGRTA